MFNNCCDYTQSYDDCENPKIIPIESKFNFEQTYLMKESFSDSCYAFVNLSIPILYCGSSKIVGLKLDQDISKKSCRIAFYGDIIETFDDTLSITMDVNMSIVNS